MKLRYYLRGLGIGIFITTIILSISLNGRRESLTNEEIIERAKELGMVQQEDTSIDKSNSESEEEKEESQAQSDKETEDKKEDPVSEKKPDAKVDTSQEESNSDTLENKSDEADTTKEDVIEMVQVDVQGGQSSDLISQVLFKAKLVDDAVAFNNFLVEKEYDQRIRVGTFSIPLGSTYEEVTKILTEK